MDFELAGDGSDSDGEGEGEGGRRWSGASGRLFLIDASRGAPRIALPACLILLRRLMSSGSRDLVAFAAYGTERDEGRGFNNAVRLTELRSPTVDDFLELSKLDLDERWGSVDECNLADALWLAARAFSTAKKKFDSKTITLVSGFGTEPLEKYRKAILTRAENELHGLGIELEFANASSNRVPPDGFFARLWSASSGKPIDDWEPPEPSKSAEELAKRLWRDTHRARASARLKLYLNADVALAVAVYHPCKPKTKPKRVALHRATNEPLQPTSSIVNATRDDGAPVLRSELRFYQNYGRRNIELSYSELTQLRKFGGAPRMTLLGFKPASTIDIAKQYLKPCAFLYPDELTSAGSSKLFRCLRDRCTAKRRIAICSIVARWYCHPRLVALVPEYRAFTENYQTQSDGFHVVCLPYEENVRDIDIANADEVSEECVNCMQQVMKKIRFVYSVDRFKNPSLDSFYNALEALALDAPESKPTEDSTLPDIETQESRIAALIDEFNELFGAFDPPSGMKRTSSNPDRVPKRRAIETPDLVVLASKIHDQTVASYTVAQLTNILRWRNHNKMPALTGLKKEQLVKLVYQYCSDI